MTLSYVQAETIAINNRIKRLSSYGEPQEDFLYANINEHLNSQNLKDMTKAWEYYMNDPDINDKKRGVINRDGRLEESKLLTNSKLAHPFMKKLTKQKQDYLLKKKPTIKHPDEAVKEILTDYFNNSFHSKLKVSGRDAIVKGKSWVQVYYDEKGVLSFKRIPTEQVIPFWKDDDHTELDGIIRIYSMTVYKADGTTDVVKKVEYHTLEGVWYYVMADKGLKPDPERGSMDGPAGHFEVVQNQVDDEGNPVVDEETGEPLTETIEAMWDKIPFVCFKYNAEETSLLNWIKSLVDDYDKNTSDTSDALQDTPNNIKVVKNYDGKDVENFNHNLNTFRTAFVSEDGDMKVLDNPVNTESSEKHLDRLRKDIYIFGNGVDTQETDLGNASGVSLTFRTLDLQTDCDDMGTEFERGIIELAHFIEIDAVGRNKSAGFDVNKIEVVFNTDTLINEKEIIDMCKASVNIISDETIRARHPWVEDTSTEADLMTQEKKVREQEELEYMKKTEAVIGTNEPN